MAAFFSSSIEYCECIICHEDYTHPVILPCAHLLCRDCLLKWLDSNPDARCPLCRRDIVDAQTRERKMFVDFVDSLPVDLAMITAMKNKQQLKRNKCCGCTKQAINSLCTTCGDTLCVQCTSSHKNLSATKFHIVKDVSSLSVEELSAVKQTACSVHGRITELFCSEHNTPVCSLCISSTHKKCSGFEDLLEKERSVRGSIAKLCRRLDEAEESMSRAIKEWDEHVQQMDHHANIALDHVQTVSKRMHQAVESFHQRVSTGLRDLMKKNKEDGLAGKTKLTDKHGLIASHKNLMNRVLQVISSDEVNVMEPELTTRVQSLELETVLPRDFKPLSKVEVSFADDVIQRLEKEVSELGEIRVVPVYKLQDVGVSSVGGKLQYSRDFLLMLRIRPVSNEMPPNLPHLPDIIMYEHPTPLLRFQSCCGRNIDLSDDGISAVRKANAVNNIIISSQQMERRKVYQIQITKLNQQWKKNAKIYLGVCGGTLPSEKIKVSPWAGNLNPSVIALMDAVYVNGEIAYAIGPLELGNLAEGSKVGVYLDGKRALHVIINGQNVKLPAPATDIPDPCFAVFDLFAGCQKVTGLPIMNLKDTLLFS